MKIKNSGELVSHGNVTGRKLILDIIEYALEAMDPRRRVRKLLSIDDGRLKVGELEYELSGIGDIYVLGAGKGSVFIAEA